MPHPFSEQESLRIEKLSALKEAGVAPYPAGSYFTNTTIAAIHREYPQDATSCQEVTVAGRLMSRRIMGGASFAELEDHTGRIQLYLRSDTLCPAEDKSAYQLLFKRLLDLGDIVGVEGAVFVTKTGALAINVRGLRLLAKALKPLPVVKEVKGAGEGKVYNDFSSTEQRYRQRYVDLVLHPEVRKVFETRAALIRCLRSALDEAGYLEAETPILQPLYGGASARPFTTYHNALGVKLYLRIANELYLKRLIVGGYPGVYEFAKDFRNEGMSRFHNPEFTQLEVYVAYRDYYWMMDYVEALIKKVAVEVCGAPQVEVQGVKIDFGKPWQRYTMHEAIHRFTGVDIGGMEEGQLRGVAQQLGVAVEGEMGKGKIIDEIFGAKCEPFLIQPTFITDYPVEMSPLAKRHRDNPALVERFEVICNGKELCNAFSELNDPLEQRKRFEAQVELGKRGDKEAMVVDEDYLRALSYGMPPTVGLGVGIDRLTMLMTGATSIQEVIFFPQMRPEK